MKERRRLWPIRAPAIRLGTSRMPSDPDITNRSGLRRIPSVHLIEGQDRKGSNRSPRLAFGRRPSYSGGREGRRRFGRSGARSESSIQTGAWSLAFSQPRTGRSTPAALRRGATKGLSRDRKTHV